MILQKSSVQMWRISGQNLESWQRGWLGTHQRVLTLQTASSQSQLLFCFLVKPPRASWKIKTENVFFVSPPPSVILKGKPSKSNFPEGLHKMSYTVFDRAGNKGSCRFTVRVRGEPLKAEDKILIVCLEQGFWSHTFSGGYLQEVSKDYRNIYLIGRLTLCNAIFARMRVKRVRSRQNRCTVHTEYVCKSLAV